MIGEKYACAGRLTKLFKSISERCDKNVCCVVTVLLSIEY